MFNVSDLNKKYPYNYSLKKSLIKTFSAKQWDKNDPFQVVAFINRVVVTNEWEWDEITYYNCKRIEFLIQEKMPLTVINKKEVYLWLFTNWQKFYFPELNDISAN
jgi:hypothetical protein